MSCNPCLQYRAWDQDFVGEYLIAGGDQDGHPPCGPPRGPTTAGAARTLAAGKAVSQTAMSGCLQCASCKLSSPWAWSFCLLEVEQTGSPSPHRPKGSPPLWQQRRPMPNSRVGQARPRKYLTIAAFSFCEQQKLIARNSSNASKIARNTSGIVENSLGSSKTARNRRK